jgi:MerR family transcriptional regulator, thiopeptide resistance regulator
MSERRRWRVGELAKASGLTVRTLHHYEHIGLLAPGSRTEGRQRLYDARDVRRLYRICALRDLGLSLAEIGRVFERGSLRDALRAHRDRVDAEIDRLRTLRRLIDHACAHSDETETLLTMIEAMTRVVRRGEERQADPKQAEARWRKLGRELRACMKAGEVPSSARARAVARKALKGILEFAGGDRATVEALAFLRKHAPPRNLAGWDAAMMRYLDQALEHVT